jgi:hypothetical protein
LSRAQRRIAYDLIIERFGNLQLVLLPPMSAPQRVTEQDCTGFLLPAIPPPTLIAAGERAVTN